MATENLTLSEAQLSACKPIHGEGGRAIRAFCPFHGSDKQRSLRVDVATGRFNCFACGAWGYTEEARERWETERKQQSPPGMKCNWRGDPCPSPATERT